MYLPPQSKDTEQFNQLKDPLICPFVSLLFLHPNPVGTTNLFFISKTCYIDDKIIHYIYTVYNLLGFSLVQFSSVAQSCLTLCDPMNHSTPGLPVHHQLLEFTQTHVHPVDDAIQPSHSLSFPSSPAPSPSQHQVLFQWVNYSHDIYSLYLHVFIYFIYMYLFLFGCTGSSLLPTVFL